MLLEALFFLDLHNMKKHLKQLTNSLKEMFNWHKSRLDCFANLLVSLISRQTVNLAHLAPNFASNTKIESNYRRIQSFFKEVEFDYDAVAKWSVEQMLSNKAKFYLALDRTNWQFGNTDINILMLSAVHEGVAIPLYWEMIPHKGNSKSEVRIELVKRFIQQFGVGCIAGILGDREFIGEKWLRWLDEESIPFVVRVKQNQLTTNSRGLEVDVSALFYGVKTHEIKRIEGKRKFSGLDVYFAGTRDVNGELLAVVSNSQNIEQLVATYGMRWEIENLFQALKGRGFNFEDTHLKDLNKISKLMALLTVGVVWAHKVGEYKDAKIKPIKRKKHGRLQYSYFRYGLDMIANAYQKLVVSVKDFKLCLKILDRSLQELLK